MFERFTEPARLVVVLAQEEARTLNHNYIGTEHLLLGLLRQEDTLAARALASLDVTLEEVRDQVAHIIGQGDEVGAGQMPFTPRAKKVLELSLREAISLGHKWIGTEHVLLGLARENEGVASRILRDLGADAETLRNQVVAMVSGTGRRQVSGIRRQLHSRVPSSSAGHRLGDVRCGSRPRDPDRLGDLGLGVRRPLLLCYHAVSPTWKHRMSIQPDLLLRQVRMLARFRRVRVSFDDAFLSAATIFPVLRQLGLPLQIFVCTGYAREGAPLTIPEFAGDDLEQLRTMTWDDLRAHADAGVTIGSHGVTHAHLTRLGEDELRRELVESREHIEEELGRPCTEFAYPYGEHDERVRVAARAARYERAYGLREHGEDPHALPRLDLYRRHGPVRALLRLYL